MKYLLAVFTASFPVSAFAHSGHTAPVDGHSHSLLDLALMGAAPVLIGLAVIGLWFAFTRNND